MTLLSVLTAPIVAIITTLLMSATAAAAPDLNGKSSLYVSTYKTSYVTCLEKSVGRKDAVAYCEAQAILAAKAAEAKRALVKAPTGPVQNSTPTGPISTAPLPTPLPTDGIREVQEDRQKYADYDIVIRLPVKITNFRKHKGKTIEESQPIVVCLVVSRDGPGAFNLFAQLGEPPKVFAEGDSYEELVTIAYKKDERWGPADSPLKLAQCALYNSTSKLCDDSGYDQNKSFCYVGYNPSNNQYVQGR